MKNKKSFFNNYFATEHLNRQGMKRSDSLWIKNRLHSNSAFIIPVFNSEFLVSKEDKPEAVFLKLDLLNEYRDQLDNFIFLGEIENNAYFCVNINDLGVQHDSLNGLGEFKELRAIAPLIDPKDAALLAYSRAMIYWHNNNRYCGLCGSPTEIGEAGYKRTCINQECLTEHFPRIDPAIIVLVSDGDKCLLARQSKWRPGQYATIAGFVEPGESLEQAVAREVYEETGVELNEIWYRSSQPWPFPSAIMLGFMATAKNTKITLHDNELEDAIWLTREEIKTKLLNDTFKLPFGISISFKLVEQWFNEGDEGNLSELLSSIDPAKR